MKCPKCGSDNVTPSHKRGMERALQYIYPKAPYRCKECWSRFWKFQSPFANRKSFAGAVVILILAIFFLVLPFFPHQENGVSSTGPEPEMSHPAAQEPATPPLFDSDAAPDEAKNAPIFDIAEKPAYDAPETPIAETPPTDDMTADAPIDAPMPADDGPGDSGTPVEPAASASKAIAGTSDEIAPKTAGKQEVPRRVTSIQAMEGTSDFRMALAATGPIENYTVFTMGRPPRLVINLSGTWEIRGQRTFPMDNDLVQRVRIGEHPRYLSVVLDLKRAVTAAPEIRKTDKGFTLTLKNG